MDPAAASLALHPGLVSWRLVAPTACSRLLAIEADPASTHCESSWQRCEPLATEPTKAACGNSSVLRRSGSVGLSRVPRRDNIARLKSMLLRPARTAPPRTRPRSTMAISGCPQAPTERARCVWRHQTTRAQGAEDLASQHRLPYQHSSRGCHQNAEEPSRANRKKRSAFCPAPDQQINRP
jgi:hypothetical protein